MLIKQEINRLISLSFFLVPWTFIFFDYLSNGFSQNKLIVWLAISVVMLLISWLIFIASQRTVYINKEKNQIIVHKTTILYKRESETFRRNAYNAILSSISPKEDENNSVELINEESGESILLASFSPESNGTFFSFGPHENSKAKMLRRTVSQFTGFKDLGFSK